MALGQPERNPRLNPCESGRLTAILREAVWWKPVGSPQLLTPYVYSPILLDSQEVMKIIFRYAGPAGSAGSLLLR